VLRNLKLAWRETRGEVRKAFFIKHERETWLEFSQNSSEKKSSSGCYIWPEFEPSRNRKD